MNVDDIWQERKKIGGIKNRVLIVAAIFGLVEHGAKSACQQKNFEQVDYLVGGRAAKHGDPDRLQAFRGGELPSKTPSLQEQFVDGKLVDVHFSRLLTSLLD